MRRPRPAILPVLAALALAPRAAAQSPSVAEAPTPAAAPAAADFKAGETSFRKCLPCHAVGEGAKNKVGPILNGLEGRTSGTTAGYSYTEANRKASIVWNAETFREYIRDPRARIPGTKMVFAGIKSEKEIADLWAYLARFDADGKPRVP